MGAKDPEHRCRQVVKREKKKNRDLLEYAYICINADNLFLCAQYRHFSSFRIPPSEVFLNGCLRDDDAPVFQVTFLGHELVTGA